MSKNKNNKSIKLLVIIVIALVVIALIVNKKSKTNSQVNVATNELFAVGMSTTDINDANTIKLKASVQLGQPGFGVAYKGANPIEANIVGISSLIDSNTPETIEIIPSTDISFGEQITIAFHVDNGDGDFSFKSDKFIYDNGNLLSQSLILNTE